MRPLPPKRHHWALAVLVAVVAGNTALSFRQSNITDDQANMLAEVLKRKNPALYRSDEIFGSSGPAALWRMRLPAWQALLGGAVRLGGAGDPLNALRILGAACMLLYLLGMYLLLLRQTHNAPMAALLAVMSVAIFSLKRPYWGVGPIFAVTPATLYLAFVPLLVLGFVQLRRRWSITGVFFLAGLCGNIHLTSAINLVLVMGIALLLLERFRGRAWALAGLSGAAAALGAAPAIYHYAATFGAAGISLPEMSIAQLRSILQLTGSNVLYPEPLTQVLRWLPLAVLLAAPAAIILTRAGRYRVRDLGAWLWLLGAAGIVAFVLHGVSQFVGWRLSTLPPVIEFFDAFRLAMLPLYVLFAQAMINLIRLARRNRAWVRAGLAALVVGYLGSSYNARPIRHMVRDAVAALAEKEPLRSDRGDKRERLRSIARWAGRDAHTPPDATFLCGEAEIRLYARRSVLFCPADVRYLYHLAPQRLAQWAENLRTQRTLLNPPEGTPADADRIVAFLDTYWQQRAGPAAPTYVLIPSRSAPPATARLQEIALPDGTRGQHWRLFRLVPFVPGATTSPS